MSRVTIDAALADPNLLGASLGDLETWRAWRMILRATYALEPAEGDLELFESLAGGREWPSEPVSELWAAAGRRSGKSRMAAAIGVHLAALVDHSARLSRGEVGHVAIVSPTKGQSRVIRDYVEGFLLASPILEQLIASTSAESIRLTNGIEVACLAGSYRSVRGRTLVGAVLDEVAFLRDENTALPDKELVRAITPALASTGGLLVGISSPYRRVGILAERHRDHYGQSGDVLVIQAPTRALNPTISQRIIDQAKKDDPEAARSEWEAEFRSDLASYLDDALIDQAIAHGRPPELPPRKRTDYHAFVDASAGRHDHFTVCIGHIDEGRFIVDALRGRAPPCDPKAVAGEFARLAMSYGCASVTGDNFAAEWVAGAFRDAGIRYQRSPMPRSALYLEALPHFARHAVEIPDHPRLIRELRLLERRTHRSGKDSVDHPRGQSDDYANSVAGCLVTISRARRRTTTTGQLVGLI